MDLLVHLATTPCDACVPLSSGARQFVWSRGFTQMFGLLTICNNRLAAQNISLQWTNAAENNHLVSHMYRRRALWSTYQCLKVAFRTKTLWCSKLTTTGRNSNAVRFIVECHESDARLRRNAMLKMCVCALTNVWDCVLWDICGCPSSNICVMEQEGRDFCAITSPNLK